MSASASGEVEFGLLGAMNVVTGGEQVQIGAPKIRIALACLLLRPGLPVTVTQLTDALWEDGPDTGSRNAVQTYVKRLRGALGPAGGLIRTHSAGYLLDVGAERVDIGRFRSALIRARRSRQAGDLTAEAAELRAALTVWRGAPLSDVPSDHLHRSEVPGLVEERMQALERRFDVDLALGQHRELVGEVQAVLAEHPLRERFWGQLMLALYRADRQADALAAYRIASRTLRDELGLDPGPLLRELHQQVLAGDPALGGGVSVLGAAANLVPAQLPADLAELVGRQGLADQLADRLAGGGSAGAQASGVPMVALSGPPGVGKTALAVHLAHRVRHHFPDGQLYADLRGFSAGSPLAPTVVLGRFLRALGVPPERIPVDLDEQSATFRSALAGRRVLVVLDNATGTEQVRPLLPGADGTGVLVTSRTDLRGLTALNDGTAVTLGALPPGAAMQLLERLLHPGRVAAEPLAAAALAEACGQLPLALRVAAANLQTRVGQSIQSYVEELDSGDRFETMSISGDDQAAVHKAFELSYAALAPPVARMFRLLSLVPGPDFDAYAAANLAGADLADGQRMLAQLLASHLVQPAGVGRLQFHDLIGAYADRQSRRLDPPADRITAYTRLFAYYLGAADLARQVRYPAEQRLTRPRFAIAPVLPVLAGPAEALSWFEAEHRGIVAAVGPAPTGQPSPVWHLVEALAPYLREQRLHGPWRDAVTAGMAAAEAAGDLTGLAEMVRWFASLDYHQYRFVAARDGFAHLVELCREGGDRAGEGRGHNGLGSVATEGGELHQAVAHFRQAAELFAGTDEVLMLTGTLANYGTTLIMTGDTALAERKLTQSLELARTHGLTGGLARAEAVLAWSALHQGRLAGAAAGFDRAVRLFQEAGDRAGELEALRNIGETALESGDLRTARQIADQILAVASELRLHWLTIGASLLLGQVALVEGSGTAVWPVLERARQLIESHQIIHWGSQLARVQAGCRRSAGDLVEATTLARLAAADVRPRERARAHAELARIALAGGDLAVARQALAAAVFLARQHGYRLDEARLRQLEGLVHQAGGDEASARACSAAADAAFSEAGTDTGDFLRELP